MLVGDLVWAHVWPQRLRHQDPAVVLVGHDPRHRVERILDGDRLQLGRKRDAAARLHEVLGAVDGHEEEALAAVEGREALLRLLDQLMKKLRSDGALGAHGQAFLVLVMDQRADVVHIYVLKQKQAAQIV